MSKKFLQTVIEVLDAAHIEHMVAGSFASTYYSDPRMTRDLDLVIDIDISSSQKLKSVLQNSDFYFDDFEPDVANKSMFNLIHNKSAWKVDLIVLKDRPYSQSEFGRRQPATISGVNVFVSSPEDTILAKLEWRQQSQSELQMRDVVGLLKAQSKNLDQKYMAYWAKELGIHLALEEAIETSKKTN